jgi:hypothetical protein
LGKFIYGMPTIEVEFDDRVLAHLQAVIVAKLRRGESFTFAWDNADEPGTLTSIWVHPAIPLQWEIEESATKKLNRAWLEELIQLSNTPTGLRMLPEPVEAAAGAKP